MPLQVELENIPQPTSGWGVCVCANLHFKSLHPGELDLQYVKNTMSPFLISLRFQVKMSNKKLEMWAKAQEKDLGRKEIWELSREVTVKTMRFYSTPMGKD